MSTSKQNSHYLIVEGGGFKTGFTSGILDAFIMAGHHSFDGYIGVSGGAVAASYFISKQYRYTLQSMLELTKDTQFLNYRRMLDEKGYMDIDTILEVSKHIVPFNVPKAVRSTLDKDVRFVVTNRLTGDPEYLEPTAPNWLDIVAASCTLPFITKGKYIINNTEYLDGGWSDALPVKWAFEQGATEITLLRTWPKETISSQTWTDYFGSMYHKDQPGLRKVFDSSHLLYNESVKFIHTPPKGLRINHLAPKKLLKSGTFSYTKKTIMNDYRYGLDIGLQHLSDLEKT